MSEDESKDVEAKVSPGGKKPYRRPEIIYREPLEAMAALCTPAPTAKATPFDCPTGPLRS